MSMKFIALSIKIINAIRAIIFLIIIIFPFYEDMPFVINF